MTVLFLFLILLLLFSHFLKFTVIDVFSPFQADIFLKYMCERLQLKASATCSGFKDALRLIKESFSQWKCSAVCMCSHPEKEGALMFVHSALLCTVREILNTSQLLCVNPWMSIQFSVCPFHARCLPTCLLAASSVCGRIELCLYLTAASRPWDKQKWTQHVWATAQQRLKTETDLLRLSTMGPS